MVSDSSSSSPHCPPEHNPADAPSVNATRARCSCRQRTRRSEVAAPEGRFRRPHRHRCARSDAPEQEPRDRCQLGVEVDDIRKGINDVVALSDRHGGQIFERKINITDDRSSTASFVIKLPPADVESAIADLDAVGIRRTASQGTEDVTSSGGRHRRQVGQRSGQSRPRSQAARSGDRPRPDTEPGEPTDRAETLVEQYTATKRALSDRVSLATLRVQLSLSPAPVATTVTEPKRRRPSRPSPSLQRPVGTVSSRCSRRSDLHRIHRAVPRARGDRSGADPDQPPPSPPSGGATKSISCSTAPTSSGRRSANVRTPIP